MEDEEYAFLPDTDIEVRDITPTFAGTLKNLLVSDDFIKTLDFPRLRFPALKGLGYSSVDYTEIAGKIDPGKIEIYETKKDEGLGFNAKFCSYGDLNFYVLTPKITATPLLSMRTLVHETTHAIQDWKKWRESPLDQEVDAHFAEALYLVKSGSQNEAKNEYVTPDFLTAVNEYLRDAKYLMSRSFRELREKLRQIVYQHYKKMNSIFSANFDPEKFKKNFTKRKRLDGMKY